MFWFGVIVSLCYIPGLTGAYIATQWPVLSVLLPFGLLRSGPFTAFHLAGYFSYASILLQNDPIQFWLSLSRTSLEPSVQSQRCTV